MLERAAVPAATKKRTSLAAVLLTPTYVCLALGLAACQFTAGGLGFWLLPYVTTELGMPKGEAGVAVGGTIAISGLLGSLAGGALLDRITAMARRRAIEAPGQNPWLRLCVATGFAFAVSLAAPFAALGSMLIESPGLFIASIGLVVGVCCMLVGPAVVGMMEAVAPEHRGMAMAMNLTCMHLLGDLMSPMLVGMVKDATGSLKDGFFLMAAWTAWCPIFFGVAAALAARNMRKSRAESCEPSPV